MGFKKWFDWDKNSSDALSYAGVIGLHLVTGTFVGAVMGYFLDKWLNTSPWFFIGMLILGIVAGFKNVLLDTKRLLNAEKRADIARKAQSKKDN